ncbi:MAG: TPM domain-containing protein [Oscillibacter sp.]|nr:TPM domain-containing protein [Oscillibacter sp.]
MMRQFSFSRDCVSCAADCASGDGSRRARLCSDASRRLFRMARLYGWSIILCLTLCVSASAYSGSYVFDEAGILSDEQAQALDNQAASMAETYNFPVYLVTVDDFTEYGFEDVYDCAVAFYEETELGFGDAHDGELLFMSMSNRKYALVYTGYGDTAFTEGGRDELEDGMLGYFRNDDWAGGFKSYLDWSEYLLSEAANGEPYGWDEYGDYHPDDGDDGPGLFEWAIVLGIPAVITIIILFILVGQMESVQEATRAKEYVIPHTLNIRKKSDRFTHITETRTKVESDSDSGGSSHHSGGGHSGRSGGF